MNTLTILLRKRIEEKGWLYLPNRIVAILIWSYSIICLATTIFVPTIPMRGIQLVQILFMLAASTVSFFDRFRWKWILTSILLYFISLIVYFICGYMMKEDVSEMLILWLIPMFLASIRFFGASKRRG
jgi:hypothetical protein